MDPMTSLLLPSAQSLVTAILTDGWTHVRDALARSWSKQTGEARADVECRLDTAHRQAAGMGDDEAVQRAYWVGYLAAVLAERPTLLDVVRELPDMPDLHNTNSGTVTNLMQARDVHGNITFGPQ
ncbi:hypothetical protein AB5J72_38195 [Streptomyces sp. CG1]|uniref:hypothetical protein n=1 Tax=Streptomyces sp. CG1 TaxID=1287523 RepID=UPI0034E209C3